MVPSAWEASSWMHHGRGRGGYLQQRAREMRKDPTPSEAELWTILEKGRCAGWSFTRQHRMEPYIVDFYCAELRLAIEVDGAAHQSRWRQKMDLQRQDNLERKGVRFLRFRNWEVWNDLPRVRLIILDALATLAGGYR